MRLIDADALQKKLTKKKSGPANARYTEGFNDALLRFKSMIHTAPTIEPERKKGEWISGAENFNTNYSHECSQCGALIDMYYGGADDYFFCPNCGADMRGEQDEK